MRHFDLSEFACPCCGQLPEEGMNPMLLEALDELREKWGDCIWVSSGYRCKEHNRSVGGVDDSQHTKGNAADVYVDGGFKEFQKFYEMVVDSELVDSVGYYPDELFLHLDQREQGTCPNYYRW